MWLENKLEKMAISGALPLEAARPTRWFRL